MRHLPRTEYTEPDQRADTNFLVGASFGRDQERERIAAQCRAWAVERFDVHGPMDARGAALWDVAAWLRESGGAG